MTFTLDPEVRTAEPQEQEQEQERPSALKIEIDRHRRLIGGLGFLLPFVLVAAAALRPTTNLSPFMESMSAYYYTSSIAFLEGSLAALGLFLMAYKGYPNKYQWADEWAARVAGGAALVIALFPTDPPSVEFKLTWWREIFGKIHNWASVVMFVMFAIFCLWLFRKTDQPKEALTRGKKWRNSA